MKASKQKIDNEQATGKLSLGLRLKRLAII